MHRRDFLKRGCLSAGATLAGETVSKLIFADEPGTPVVPVQERICLFTDHLDHFGYTYSEVAKMLSPLKIAGPDLTVRPGSVVSPAHVTEELPKAAAAFRDQGLSIPMVSTNLTSANDATARPTLTAMKELGIRYFKLGYYHYHELAKWETELEALRKSLAGLVELGGQFNTVAGFHNHAGPGVGGALWDAWALLQPLNPANVGFYFDPAHASIEGAKHAWKLNLQRISARLKMVAVKDYVWEKSKTGWQTRWCPLGEGMVNWSEFFRQLAQYPFPGPLSVHIEYDPGGATRMERIDNSLAAAQHDIAFVRRHLDQALRPK